MLTSTQIPPLKTEFDPEEYPELYSFCVDTISEFDTTNMEAAEISGWPDGYRISVCLKSLIYATRHVNTYHNISVLALLDRRVMIKKNGLKVGQMKIYRRKGLCK